MLMGGLRRFGRLSGNCLKGFGSFEEGKIETFYFLLVEPNMGPNQTYLTEIFQLSSLNAKRLSEKYLKSA